MTLLTLEEEIAFLQSALKLRPGGGPEKHLQMAVFLTELRSKESHPLTQCSRERLWEYVSSLFNLKVLDELILLQNVMAFPCFRLS